MNIPLILAVIELLLRLGPQAFVSALKELNVDKEPTVEEIRALAVKPPEEYLNEGKGN